MRSTDFEISDIHYLIKSKYYYRYEYQHYMMLKNYDCNYLQKYDIYLLLLHDQNIDLTANLTLEHIELAWVEASADYDFLLNSGHFIRGPPFDASPPHAVSTDLYLTTQRLRI